MWITKDNTNSKIGIISTTCKGLQPAPSCDCLPLGLCCEPPDIVRGDLAALFTKRIQSDSITNSPLVHHNVAGNFEVFTRVTALPYDVYRNF